MTWHDVMTRLNQFDTSYIAVTMLLWLRYSGANTSHLQLQDPLSKTNSPGRQVFRCFSSKQKEKHAALGWPAACIIQSSVVRRRGTRSPRVVAPGLYRDALKKSWMLSQQQEGVPIAAKCGKARMLPGVLKHVEGLHTCDCPNQTCPSFRRVTGQEHEDCETMTQWSRAL